jgi:hypothetical protein
MTPSSGSDVIGVLILRFEEGARRQGVIERSVDLARNLLLMSHFITLTADGVHTYRLTTVANIFLLVKRAQLA